MKQMPKEYYEQLEELQAVVRDAEALLQATATHTGERVASVRARAEESLQQAKQRQGALAMARGAGRPGLRRALGLGGSRWWWHHGHHRHRRDLRRRREVAPRSRRQLLAKQDPEKTLERYEQARHRLI